MSVRTGKRSSNRFAKTRQHEAVLAFARADRRAVLTLNRKHFVHLHSAQPEHEGIIVCTFDPDSTELANRIHAAIRPEAPLAGQLIRVNRPTP